jgi:hypothetical protein
VEREGRTWKEVRNMETLLIVLVVLLVLGGGGLGYRRWRR